MVGLLVFAYGLAAYVFCVAVLLYLAAFSGSLLVARTVDVGPLLPWTEAASIDVALLVLFAVQHSVMARRGFKRWLECVVPRTAERSTFVLATCLVLALMFWQWRPIPEPVLWRAEGIAVPIAWSLFALGWVLLLASSFLIDHFELFGLRQAFSHLSELPAPSPAFKTPLLYRYVRHPIYVGVLLGVWATPVMTAGHLLFALGCTAYILVGVRFEERDLVAQFGDRYRAYRAQVGMLLPRRRAAAVADSDRRAGSAEA
jgi:protein-S-isoprenylcysteine O-methyltransferase Ste14